MSEDKQGDSKQDSPNVSDVSIVQKALENVSAGGNINVNIVQNANHRPENVARRGNSSIDWQQRKIDTLKRERETVYRQWESEINDEHRAKLWLRIEQKTAEIEEVEQG